MIGLVTFNLKSIESDWLSHSLVKSTASKLIALISAEEEPIHKLTT